MEEKESIAKAEESISKVLAHINIALKQIKCERVIEEKDCLCKNWDTLTKADFQDLMSAGYTPVFCPGYPVPVLLPVVFPSGF